MHILEYIVCVITIGILNELLSFLYIPIINHTVDKISKYNFIASEWMLILLFYCSFSIGIRFLNRFTRNKFNINLNLYIKKRLIEKLWENNPGEIKETGESNYLLACNKAAECSKYLDSIISIVFSGLMFFVVIIYMILFMSLGYFIVMVALVVVLFLSMGLNKPLENQQAKIYKSQKRNLIFINNMMDGINIIKNYSMEKKMEKSFANQMDQVVALENKKSDYKNLLEVWEQFIRCTIMIAIPALSSVLVYHNIVNEGSILVSSYSFFYIFGIVTTLMKNFGILNECKAGILLLETIWKSNEIPSDLGKVNPLHCIGEHKELSVKNMNFCYGEKEILQNISITFPSKGISVIKGESGIGKSTFLECLVGLQNVSKDCLLLGDTAIENGQIYQIITYVPQTPVVYMDMNAYENIRLAGDNITDEQIDNLLEQLNPLACRILKNRSDVVGLSGGQKQLINVARAILSKANYIVMDEVTSALDEKTAENVMKYIKILAEKKCIIIASHDRLVTKYADTIYQMKDKNISIVN